jgi:AraC family transcriptional regulator, regulatory protein of adaptative response / methylated-DNA-[protein]-cysteine methyltransferase
MKAARTKQIRADSTTSDPRWQAILTRNSQADGTFLYSVESTGVYCRPSCPSRLARPENVRFHDSSAAAETAGFRPCKRCTPNELRLREQHAAKIAEACRRIERALEEPSLGDLAFSIGMSRFHFHRVFRAVTGVTPKQYAAANRTKSIRQKLRSSKTVTEALYDAGYNSSGRFYDTSDRILGMKPTSFRAGGKDEEIRFAVGQTTLGAILIGQSERGICAILLGDNPDLLIRDLEDRFPRADLIGGDASFEALVARVVGLVETPGIGLDLPLDIRGTAFQQRVWQALRELPVGSRASYTEIAGKIGLPRSVRAVARACAANALAVAIPCHRVVRSDGSLSGYRWGIERKRMLLEREAQ